MSAKIVIFGFSSTYSHQQQNSAHFSYSWFPLEIRLKKWNISTEEIIFFLFQIFFRKLWLLQTFSSDFYQNWSKWQKKVKFFDENGLKIKKRQYFSKLFDKKLVDTLKSCHKKFDTDQIVCRWEKNQCCFFEKARHG